MGQGDCIVVVGPFLLKGGGPIRAGKDFFFAQSSHAATFFLLLPATKWNANQNAREADGRGMEGGYEYATTTSLGIDSCNITFCNGQSRMSLENVWRIFKIGEV